MAAVLLRDLVTSLYDKLGPNFKSQKVVGQLCDTPILYCYENSQIWRPCTTDETGTQAWRFEIVAAGGDAYDRELPLKTPPLSIREEFPVVRAKRRPVILLKLAATGNETGSLAATKALPMVIPLYGVVDEMGKQKLSGGFLERVQRLEFPEFFFLPADGAAVKEDSLVPLYRMAHAFEGHLDARQWKLSDSLFRVLTGQINFGSPVSMAANTKPPARCYSILAILGGNYDGLAQHISPALGRGNRSCTPLDLGTEGQKRAA